MTFRWPRRGTTAAIVTTLGFGALRLSGAVSGGVAIGVLCASAVPAILASAARAISDRLHSRWLIVCATISAELAGALVAIEHIRRPNVSVALALVGAIVTLGLLSWGLVLEVVPLMPVVNRRRAMLDSAVSAVLLAATGWNVLLVTAAHPEQVMHQVLVVAVLLLLLIPTAFAAAGSVNDPTDRRLKRLALACGSMTLTGVAGLVGPAIARSSAVFEVIALPTLALVAFAVGTESNGSRPVLDLTDRLRRRMRITTGLNVAFVVSLFVAMWTIADHEVMGVMTTAVLVLIIAVQKSAAGENLELTGQLADQIDELAVSEERFRALAATDELTGLMNRRAFVARLDAELARDASCSVLFLDLDRFKEVNDSLGHDAGDDLLVQLGRRLDEVLRGVGSVARFGGDEFVVLMLDTPTERAAVACGERILSILASPIVVDGSQTFAAASIGVAVSGPNSTSATLLSDADAAMYAAKAQGRSRVVAFSQELRDRVAGRLDVANQLHVAIEMGELRVHYQPILRLDDEALSGFEALVRWQHPTRGLLAPAAFLDVAEDTGLIVPLGATVLNVACEQLGEWIREGVVAADTTVAVNLAPRQLSDPTVIALVADALVSSGLPARNLVLELTESALMSEAPEVDLIVARLVELGVRFSVDDFGTGYSSLTYLKRFPVHVLKVDRSFVNGLPNDGEDLAIVNAVVGLAAGMGFRCVAEGIEDEVQAAYLRSIGCSHGQGYLFAKPMCADDVTSWAMLGSRRSRPMSETSSIIGSLAIRPNAGPDQPISTPSREERKP